MEYKYTPEVLAAKALDDVNRTREFLTGLRNGLIADGWSERGAEVAVIEVLRSGNRAKS